MQAQTCTLTSILSAWPAITIKTLTMYSGQTANSNVDTTVDNKPVLITNNNNNNNNNGDLGYEYHHLNQQQQQQEQQQKFFVEHKKKLNDRIEWSRDKILGFIEDYRRERVLWDPNCRGYHIKQIKYEALKELGLKYGAEIRAIRSKIKSLRSSFHREHGKVINGQRKGVHYQPVWFAYDAIRFILDENLTTVNNQQQLLHQQQLHQEQQQQQLMKQETLSTLLNASREILQNCALQTTTTTTNTTTTTLTTTTTNNNKFDTTAPNISSTFFTNDNNNNNNNNNINTNHINHNWSLQTTLKPKPELQITKNDYSSNSENYSNHNSDAEAVDRVAFFTAAAMAAVTAAVASAGTSRTEQNTPTNFFDNPPTPHNGWIIRAEDIKTEILSNDDEVNAEMPTPMIATTTTTTSNEVNNKNTTTSTHSESVCNNNFRKRKYVDGITTTKSQPQQQSRSNKLKTNKKQFKLPTIRCLDSSSQTDVATLTPTPTPAVSNTTTTTTNTANSDEHGIFGDYVAITIRKLKTAKAKIVVKHIINNVLYEAEMGKYDLGMPATTDPPQLYQM